MAKDGDRTGSPRGTTSNAPMRRAHRLPMLLTCLLLATSRGRLRLAALSLLTLCTVYGLSYPLSSTYPAASPHASVETFVGASLRKLNPELSSHSLFAAECTNSLPYLSSAFVNPWDEVTGSKCFGVYFLKSMLFGEFHFGSLEAWHISFLLLGLGVLVWIGLTISAVQIPRSAQLFTITHLLVQLGYYSTVQISPAADFRYVLPILIPLSLGGATALAKLRLLEAGTRLLAPKAECSLRS